MTCIAPLRAWRSKERGSSGKLGITFERDMALSGEPFRLPCGQCIGCRLDHSLQWAVRCMHEKQLHDRSSFVTLTYNNENLPEGGTLVKRDLQLFMKRLRKKCGEGIRFYAAGEYGEQSMRPHYHIILFNMDFEDQKYYAQAKRGEKLYTSETLAQLWPKGYNVIGEVTLESCAYVARYVCQKITGDKAHDHYRVVTKDGVIVDRIPEFSVMSRRPGVASGWYERYGRFSHKNGDFAVLEGKKVRMPRYYDAKYEIVDAEGMEVLKGRRRIAARRFRMERTPERRRVKEAVLYARYSNMERTGE